MQRAPGTCTGKEGAFIFSVEPTSCKTKEEVLMDIAEGFVRFERLNAHQEL